MLRTPIAIALAALLAACASTPMTSAPSAPEPVTLRVNVFRGASNIPLYMVIKHGHISQYTFC